LASALSLAAAVCAGGCDGPVPVATGAEGFVPLCAPAAHAPSITAEAAPTITAMYERIVCLRFVSQPSSTASMPEFQQRTPVRRI
jgi:hypothetical protein